MNRYIFFFDAETKILLCCESILFIYMSIQRSFNPEQVGIRFMYHPFLVVCLWRYLFMRVQEMERMVKGNKKIGCITHKSLSCLLSMENKLENQTWINWAPQN
jgi:hypothetical protein